MKKIHKRNNKNFLKKIFIKLSRLLGYEIIDQSSFYVPTQKKSLNDNLSIPGKKSISIPLGEVNISRKVKALTIIFRSCMSVNMLTQNKKRLFDKKKYEYTLRSLNSILKSLNYAKNSFSNIDINLIIIDHQSEKKYINVMQNLLNKFNFNNTIVNLNINDFINEINKTNAEGNLVTNNQISNMSNIYQSLQFAKNKCEDLIYFCEDDYIHHEESIVEMLFSYERFSSLVKKEVILCPVDYPYLYNKTEPTSVFLGSARHWRVIDETLCTFLTSKQMVINHWDKYTSMCKFEHYPFEMPLHQIYEKEYCFSPIPSLAMHCTNINSAYGISPNTKWEELWNFSGDY
jgi:hypothetical protein